MSGITSPSRESFAYLVTNEGRINNRDAHGNYIVAYGFRFFMSPTTLSGQAHPFSTKRTRLTTLSTRLETFFPQPHATTTNEPTSASTSEQNPTFYLQHETQIPSITMLSCKQAASDPKSKERKKPGPSEDLDSIASMARRAGFKNMYYFMLSYHMNIHDDEDYEEGKAILRAPL